MSRAVTPVQNPADAVATHLVRAGYARCEPPILQPASIFFDSGEDLRAQLYLTSDLSGAEYCLRPGIYNSGFARTISPPAPPGRARPIPIAARCSAIAPGEAASSRRPASRVSAVTDPEAADAGNPDARARGRRCAPNPARSRPQRAHRRCRAVLRRSSQRSISRRNGAAASRAATARASPLAGILDASRIGAGRDHSGVLCMLEGADKQGARAFVEDLLSIAGIASVGGRTPAEIADRFLEQAALRAGVGVSAEKLAIIERFLRIEGDPNSASAQLRELARRGQSRSRGAVWRPSTRGSASSPRSASMSRRCASRRVLRATSIITPASSSRRMTARGPTEAGRRRRALRSAFADARRRARHSRRRRGDLDRSSRRVRERWGTTRMSDTLVLAVPSKGRLQENAAAFFARAGLDIVQGRGARDYRGSSLASRTSRSPSCRPPTSSRSSPAAMSIWASPARISFARRWPTPMRK